LQSSFREEAKTLVAGAKNLVATQVTLGLILLGEQLFSAWRHPWL
jgi:hypothetical protein